MPAAAALPPSLPLLVCPFGRRYLRSMQSRMEEENRRGERLRSLMKIMISLKTYSSLPLAAAEKEGEEEEFSVKARYNAEREREKNAGREGEDRHLLQVQLCNCSSHWKLAKDGVVVVGEDATGENYATDALKRKVGFGLPIQPVISLRLPSGLI